MNTDSNEPSTNKDWKPYLADPKKMLSKKACPLKGKPFDYLRFVFPSAQRSLSIASRLLNHVGHS